MVKKYFQALRDEWNRRVAINEAHLRGGSQSNDDRPSDILIRDQKHRDNFYEFGYEKARIDDCTCYDNVVYRWAGSFKGWVKTDHNSCDGYIQDFVARHPEDSRPEEV